MARTPSPEEALERARRSQETRLEAIRVLAEARHAVVEATEDRERRLAVVEQETRTAIADATGADVKAWNAATAVGWSRDELRKIGFDMPTKGGAKPRGRKPRNAAPEATPADTTARGE